MLRGMRLGVARVAMRSFVTCYQVTAAEAGSPRKCRILQNGGPVVCYGSGSITCDIQLLASRKIFDATTSIGLQHSL